MKKEKHIAIILFVVFGANCFAEFSSDSIRIAHIQWLADKPMPQQFLTNAKTAGYNYILAEYAPREDEWDHNGKIIAKHPTNFEKRLTQHFQQVDSAGLRLIPLLSTGTGHAAFYKFVIDSQIPNQLVHQKMPRNALQDNILFDSLHCSFVMSPDGSNAGAKRMISAFDSLWTMVFNAFNSAKTTMTYKNLDFVHLAYDENVYNWYNKSNIKCQMPYIGLCASDTSWLKANGLKGSPTETQIQRLYAANIKKRTTQILSIANKFSFKTKILLWADMFDPYFTGGNPNLYSFKHLFNSKLQSNNSTYCASDSISDSLVKIQLTGTLNQTDLLAVKDSVIFCPWVFGSFTYVSGVRYIPKDVIDTITSKGYKLLYACAGGYIFGFDSQGKPYISTLDDGAYVNAFEFAISAHDSKFNGKAVGYISTHWSDLTTVDLKQGNLIWNVDSNYIKPYNFMGVMTKINFNRTSQVFHYR